MNKKYLYMFLSLQLMLIIINFFNINTSIFNIEISQILKVILIIFSMLYFMFISNANKSLKLVVLNVLLIVFLIFILKEGLIFKTIDYFYYILTYTFLIFYYSENRFKKYIIVNISSFVLIALNIYLLITKSHSLTLEYISCILLPISLLYFKSNKNISLLMIVLSLLVGYFNDMTLVIYNTLLISLIAFIDTLLGEEKILYPSISLILSIIFFAITNLYSKYMLFDALSKFDRNINLYSIVAIIPLIVLLVLVIYNLAKTTRISFQIFILFYILVFVTTFGFISFENINNEVIILLYSYLFILELDNLRINSKRLQDKVTILALHLGYGGIEQYISSLTKMIDKKIDIIATYKVYDNPPYNYNKSNISYLINYGPNKEELKKALKKKNIFKIIIEGLRSLKVLYLKKYENINCIENIDSKYIITTRDFHNELVSLYAQNDITKIATEHNYHNNDKRYISRLTRSVSNVDYLVLVSKYLEEYYRDRVKCSTIYIPNVIEELPKKESKNYGHNLISVGRLSKVKAQKDLIKLTLLLKEEYKDIKLTIVGDGEEKNNLNRLIKKYELEKNVTITGFLNKDEIEKLYVKNNIFVTTSKSEAFGLVAIEACSYKLPVVAFSSALGLQEILENDNGVLIDNRNIEEMKEKIINLFEDKKYRDKIAKNGYNNSKKYLMSDVSLMWKEIIK